MLEIVEDIVEHPVPLGAGAGPIGRIEAWRLCLLVHSPQSFTNSLTISFADAWAM
jgi:hypothetical protein